MYFDQSERDSKLSWGPEDFLIFLVGQGVNSENGWPEENQVYFDWIQVIVVILNGIGGHFFSP